MAELIAQSRRRRRRRRRHCCCCRCLIFRQFCSTDKSLQQPLKQTADGTRVAARAVYPEGRLHSVNIRCRAGLSWWEACGPAE